MLETIKIITLIGIFGTCVAIIWLQQKQLTVVKAQSETSILTLEVSLRQNKYVLREPIQLNFKLSNQTGAPIKFDGFYGLGQSVNFLVRDESGKEILYETSKYYRGGLTGIHELSPKKEIESENLLDGELSEIVFSKPGQYEVKVEFSYKTGEGFMEPVKVLSNSFTININEPKGIDKLAYDYLTKIYEPARQKSNATPLKQLRQDFVDKFSNSVYSKYIAFELVQIYEGREDAKAMRELCKIHNLNFFYSKDVKKRLLKINARLHPIVPKPNLLPDDELPIVIHPCTGRPIDPMNF